jgi:hypothetical protein
MKCDPGKVIDRIGGTVKVSVLCRCTKGAVSQWRIYGIPPAREQFLRVVHPEAFMDEQDVEKAA